MQDGLSCLSIVTSWSERNDPLAKVSFDVVYSDALKNPKKDVQHTAHNKISSYLLKSSSALMAHKTDGVIGILRFSWTGLFRRSPLTTSGIRKQPTKGS